MKQNITNKKINKFLAIHELCKSELKSAMDVNLELDETSSFRTTSGIMLEMSKVGLLERIEITKSKVIYKSIDCDAMDVIKLKFNIYENTWEVPLKKSNKETKASKKEIKNANGQVIGQIRTIAEKHPTRNRLKAEWRGIGSSFNIV